MSEFKLTIDRNPSEPTKGPKLAAAKAANEEAAKEIRERRKKVHRMHSTEAAAQVEEKRPTGEPIPPREDLESITIPLRNGLVVEYGPPQGVSLTDRLARFFGDRDPTVSQARITRLLMCVRSIDGQPVSFSDEIGRTKLANRIGDEGIDLLFHFDRQYWPPLRQAELPQIKKNLRSP